MKARVLWLVLLVAILLGTMLLGWWTVPLAGAAWGLAARLEKGTWWRAALAGTIAWALLLLFAATQGPVGTLAAKMGAVFALPGFAFALLTLVFPALLAGSAAELASTLRRAWVTNRNSSA